MEPKTVGLAIKLLWASIAIGLVAAVLNIVLGGATQSSGSFIFSLSLISFLIFKTSAGNNWARIALLIFQILGAPLILGVIIILFHRSIALGTLAIIQVPLIVYALFLIFTDPGKEWFRNDIGMLLDNANTTSSITQRMPFKKAFLAISGYSLIASAISILLLGLLWEPLQGYVAFLENCKNGSFFYPHFGGPISSLKIFFTMRPGIIRNISSIVAMWLPLALISTSAWTLLQKYDLKGWFPLILASASAAYLYAQIIIYVSQDPGFKYPDTILFIIYNDFIWLGGAFTALIAYPKFKKIEIEKK